MTPLDTILQRAGLTLQDVGGSTFEGELPLTDTVVNRFIAAQLAQRSLPVLSVRLEAQPGDAFTAHVVPKARLVPPLRIDALVELQPDFPTAPVLWLRWSMRGAGPLALLAGPALAFFNALPAGVNCDGDRIAIDLGQLLAARGLGDMVQYVRGVRIHTRAGVFVVRFQLRIPGGATVTEAVAGPDSQ